MSIDLSDNLEKSLGTQTSLKICSGKKNKHGKTSLIRRFIVHR